MSLSSPSEATESSKSALRSSLAERRRIGAYYSPTTITDALASWAIQKKDDVVLEPGFGGCGFLGSCIDRLGMLGAKNPGTQLFGCDIDPYAFHVLYSRLGLTEVTGRFVLEDFLALQPEAFCHAKFDVVIGNPPYIGHHNIKGKQKERAREIRNRLLPKLNLQANLWAYFVIHACQFLKSGGRAAWILPSSFLNAYYAKEISVYLQSNFTHARIVRLDERIFEREGAAEGTVVVVANGWKRQKVAETAGLKVESARSVEELKVLLSSPICVTATHEDELFERLALDAQKISDYCKLSIGIVTGAAKFFLFDSEKARAQGIGARNLIPIVSRAKFAAGLSVSENDLRLAYQDGAACMMLDTRGRIGVNVARYLKTMSEAQIKDNLTFGKRPVWHRPLDGAEADAFFTCMSHYGPRLVLNRSNDVTCTNTLYRGKFHPHVNAIERKALCVALVSSFGQLSAERSGRAYGAGMLKHEPSEAEAIKLLVPSGSRADIGKAFNLIDRALKVGNETAARHAADQLLITQKLISPRDCSRIQAELKHARALRLGGSFS